MRSAKDTKAIRSVLLDWYRREARMFPWRSDTTSAYEILVSEVMLQQTQAARVADLLPAFLEQFPNVQALANASNADVVRAWKGLGYNNRAIRLRDAAQRIVQDHGGDVPMTEEQLRSLPGIGPYTSAAIACFAFGVRTVVVDVNIRRVYSRLTASMSTTNDLLSDADVASIAESLIPKNKADEWHQAVMDLGALLCTARSPQCTACPLQHHCASAHTMIAVTRQRRPERTLRGEPLRLWRGRIVQLLRDHDGDIQVTMLEERIFDAVSSMERDTINGMLDGLVRDGLIKVKGATVSLA
jgi:A/G-specific adenine glycosylase